MREKPELLFVSTRFLFPTDSGGKIRTTQILRGLKGGRFDVVLASPATMYQRATHEADLQEICDHFIAWRPPTHGRLFQLTRMRHLVGPLPIPVRTDRHRDALSTVRQLIEQRRPALVVFDFIHAAVLAPETVDSASVVFTHNVEAEIFRRHRDVAGNPVYRAVWNNQYRKMLDFERNALRRFDVVVAVAARDAEQFSELYGIQDAQVIPTGVDLQYFGYEAPRRNNEVVFLGSMDWMANQEAVEYFLDEVWDLVLEKVPDARMTVVGRAPPPWLVRKAKQKSENWSFTDVVDDVRPFVQGSSVFVIPLRVGGGTRLKVYEAMAMGTPVVSTSIGVEGLPVEEGRHYLRADNAGAFADAVSGLLINTMARHELSARARSHVEQHFCYKEAARVFEKACSMALDRFGAGSREERIAI